MIHEQLRFKGFKFLLPRRLGEEISALENDGIYGDSFNIGSEMIEHIGNNVTVSFNGIDLSGGANAVEITGRTHNEHDTLHLRFASGEMSAVEFEHSEDIVTRRFDIAAIEGVMDLQLVFLPGSDFDLKSFRFVRI